MRVITAVLVSLAMVFAFAAPASAATTSAKWANSDKSNCSVYTKGPGAAQVTIKPGSSRTDTYDHIYFPKGCAGKVTRGLGPTYWPKPGKWTYMPSNAWKTWIIHVKKQ